MACGLEEADALVEGIAYELSDSSRVDSGFLPDLARAPCTQANQGDSQSGSSKVWYFNRNFRWTTVVMSGLFGPNYKESRTRNEDHKSAMGSGARQP